MKKLLTTLAVFAFALVFSTQSAEAKGHRQQQNSHNNHQHSYQQNQSYAYVSGHSSCGCKVYTKRYVRYYDCHGHAVYGYSRQPVQHHCHSSRQQQRRAYNNSCGTGHGQHSNRRSSGWSVSYRF